MTAKLWALKHPPVYILYAMFVHLSSITINELWRMKSNLRLKLLCDSWFYQSSFLLCSFSSCSSSQNLPVFFFSCSVFFPLKTTANMWFHLSSSEIRVEKNRLMVILLSLPLFLLSLHTVAGLDERACIFCLSFKFCCLKKLQMWAARHTYTKMLDRKNKNYVVWTKRRALLLFSQNTRWAPWSFLVFFARPCMLKWSSGWVLNTTGIISRGQVWLKGLFM